MNGESSDEVRSILVTGGARRVGAAIVRQLHAAGCNVVIHCNRSFQEAAGLAAELEQRRQDSTCVVQADLREIAVLPGLVDKAVARFGRLDGLVNNASSFFRTPVGEITEDNWDDLIGSNLKAPLFLTQVAAAQLVANCGAVVNIVDIHADRPMRGYPVYSSAKAGLQGLTRALAIELAPHVRVNGVAPGPIDWPENGQIDAAQREAIISHTLLKRSGRAEEIAAAVKFLLLDASYVTGQVLGVDGGRSVNL